MLQNVEIIHTVFDRRRARPPLGMEKHIVFTRRQVCKKHTERDTDKQQRLEFLFDTEPQEEQRDDDRHRKAEAQSVEAQQERISERPPELG